MVNNGGTLGGTGNISGAVAVNSGGTLAPGNGPGIIHTGAVTLNSGGTYSVDINGGSTIAANGAGTLYDQTIVNGNINLNGGNLSLTLGATPLAIGDKFFIALSNGTVSGTFANTTGGGTIYTQGPDVFLVNYFDSGGDGSNLNDISLTVSAIPETSTWLAGALALVAIGFMQRRRFAKRSRVTS
jgi:MYXO-CTERM domain-containing protein